MRPKQVRLNTANHSSFHVRRDVYPQNHNSWHYHEELELVMIYKGEGSLYMGDTIIDFSEGNCILIGSQIPHFWLFHNINEDKSKCADIDCVVIHFNIDFAGNTLFDIPELHLIKKLVKESEKGIMIDNEPSSILHTLFQDILMNTGANRFTSLIKILDHLSSREIKNIVSENYSRLNNSTDEKRMKNVMNYIQNYYNTKIELIALANEAKMTKNSFCRYFKQKTGKSPTEFINELRIAHACRLLKNTDMSLKEICYDSGFNNFVSFHKIFKTLNECTPIQYRKK